MKYITAVVVIGLLLCGPFVNAKLIGNPEAVSYMHTIVSKSGSVWFEKTGNFPRVESLDITLSIPQDTYNQKVRIVGVEGPDSYNITEDRWGNQVMKISWNRPDINRELPYNVSFDVKTYQKSGTAPGKSFPVTELTEASPEIKRVAYSQIQGLNGTEAMLALAAWVYYAVDYRMGYEGLQKSAKWVFENRKAVCDGHANLLISMLRSVGYNAYYVIGYAYTERTPGRYFGAHGWVEAEYGGRLITLDPTWLESPADATHIKFSNAPDSNYSEYIWAMSSNVKVHWKRNEPSITLLEKEESPRISIHEDVIPETVGGGKSALIVADVAGREGYQCVLGRIEALSCSTKSGRPFLDIEERNRTMMFCGEDKVFWFARAPEVEKNMLYTCPVTVSGGGETVNRSVEVKRGRDDITLDVDTQKVLLPGENFVVRTVLSNEGFVDRDLKVYIAWNGELRKKDVTVGKRGSREIVWTLESPARPGEYRLTAFSSSGDRAEESLTVSERRRIRIVNVSVPSVVDIGRPLGVNITVLGLEDSVGEIVVKIGEKEERRSFSIQGGEEKVFLFSSGSVKEGRMRLSVDVFSGNRNYEDGMVTSITISHERNWIEDLIERIGELFKWLLSILHLG